MTSRRKAKLIDQAIRNISDAISWKETPEGHAFWFGVVNKLIREARKSEREYAQRPTYARKVA